MARLIVAAAAKSDLANVLDWSAKNFGERAGERYEALIFQSLLDIADDPNRIGVDHRPDLRPGLVTYRLLFSRRTAAHASEPVKRPRHLLAFRVRDDGSVVLLRILHESMDLKRHVQDDAGD